MTERLWDFLAAIALADITIRVRIVYRMAVRTMTRFVTTEALPDDRLKNYARAVRLCASMIAPLVREPEFLAPLAESCDRDIYRETCEAMGYDPLTR